MLPSIDRDGNGQITVEELKNHILYMMTTYVEANVNRAWKMFGEKLSNNRIKWDDYREIVFAPHGMGCPTIIAQSV